MAELARQLDKHFKASATRLPVVEATFSPVDHADLHSAIERELNRAGEVKLVGVVSAQEWDTPSLAKIVLDPEGSRFMRGPVEYRQVEVDVDRFEACVQQGMYLARNDDRPIAVMMTFKERGPMQGLSVEVMTPAREDAEDLIRRLRRAMRQHSVYRGKVITLDYDCYRQMQVRFGKLPDIDASQIVLPQGLLERIERHALAFTRHAEALSRSGMHLKRGLLLHGPPGTGKTLSAMYLAACSPDRTVFRVTGRGVGIIEQSCVMARALQPATIILEDVDLVATERSHQEVGANALLFELLNQMDGLEPDADVLFVLTTNRPDILEPALAARPGRIDQAIEVPMPDDTCRSRLFDLYGRHLALESEHIEEFVKRTKGASAAFIRELLRSAALRAADEGSGSTVGRHHLDAALGDMVLAGKLGRSLLGAGDQVE